MSDPGERKRPLHHQGITLRAEGDQDHPSVGGTMVLTVIAICVTLIVLVLIGNPNPNNIPGDAMSSVILAALALWIDWCTMQRWEKIAAKRRVSATPSQSASTRGED